MRSRTKAKGQNDKRIRRAALKVIFLLLLGFSLWRGWEYTKPDSFPIKNVKIFGSYEHVSQESLQEAIGPYLSNGFFYLNVIGLKKKLLSFPWIYTLSVKRKWPDTVLINIVEQRAILQWGSESLISSFGDVFSPSKTTFPKNLPVIFGPDDQKTEIFAVYKKMKVLFDPVDLVVKKLLLSPRHYWEVLLNSGTMVYLKEKEPLDQIESLVGVYRKITASHKKAPKSIDLRYQSGLAVRWK